MCNRYMYGPAPLGIMEEDRLGTMIEKIDIYVKIFIIYSMGFFFLEKHKMEAFCD